MQDGDYAAASKRLYLSLAATAGQSILDEPEVILVGVTEQPCVFAPVRDKSPSPRMCPSPWACMPLVVHAGMHDKWPVQTWRLAPLQGLEQFRSVQLMHWVIQGGSLCARPSPRGYGVVHNITRKPCAVVAIKDTLVWVGQHSRYCLACGAVEKL